MLPVDNGQRTSDSDGVAFGNSFESFLKEIPSRSTVNFQLSACTYGVLPARSTTNYFLSSFQKALLKNTRCKISKIQPQVMKQSATLNTANRMKSTSIMSTT